MITRSRIIVLLLLLLILAIAAWSKLSQIDASDYEPQRIRLEDHPAFNRSEAGNG